MKVPAFIIVTLACCLVGCSTLPTAGEHRAQLQAKLSTVVIEDGISQSEADIIAENYYFRFTQTACGSVLRVTEEDSIWIARTYYGPAAMPTREPIRIDKRSGRVTWSDGPTMSNPKMIW